MKIRGINAVSPIRSVFAALSILALFFLYKESGSSVFLYPALIIMGVYAVFFNPLEVFMAGIFLVSQVRLIRIEDNPLALVGLFMMVAQMKYLVVCRLRISFWFVLALFTAFMTSMSYSDTSSLSMAIRSVLFLVFIYSFSCDTIEKYQEDFIKIFIWGCVVSVLMSLYSVIKGGGFIFSGSFSAMDNDRNFYAANIITGLGATLACFSRQRFKVLYLGFAVFLIFGGLITGSRTFFICLIPLLVMVFLQMLSSGDSKVRKNAFLIILISGGVCVAVLPVFLPILDEILLSRFMDDNVSTGSGRLDQWEFFINLACSTPGRFLLGNGQGDVYVKAGMVQFVEHNTYIQAFSTYGIVGFISILGAYFCVFKKLLRNTLVENKWTIFPLLSTLLFYFTINALYSSIFDISLFVVIMLIITLNPKRKRGGI